MPRVGTYRLTTSAARITAAALSPVRAAADDTAVITFTPVAGYTGTAPGVTFQITDAYGQQVTAGLFAVTRRRATGGRP